MKVELLDSFLKEDSLLVQIRQNLSWHTEAATGELFFLTVFYITQFYMKCNEACNFIQKETLEQVSFYGFCETFKNTFSLNTSGRLLLDIPKRFEPDTKQFLRDNI